MKSIKRGRGPSMVNCLAAVAAAVFGVVWVIAAIKMGAPAFFPVFGAVFILAAAVQAVYSYKNATSKNRFSEFDITEDGEEPDPLETKINERAGKRGGGTERGGFCPYCGRAVGEEFDFCPGCGRKLPFD